jgi:hypothetical protein
VNVEIHFVGRKMNGFLQIVQAGKLTSYASGRNQSEHFGLGYIKRQGASEGDSVIVGDNISGTVVEVPFLSQQQPPSSTSNS